MDEVKDFHPVVERWLKRNGYKAEHHVHLDHGIVDFIATHRETGEVLCVECKVHTKVTNREIGQVLTYAHQIPGCIPCLMIPSWDMDEKTQSICDDFGIRLIGVKAKRPVKKKEPKQPISSRYGRKKFNKISYAKKKFSFTRWHSDFVSERRTSGLKMMIQRLIRLEADMDRRNRPRWLHTNHNMARYIPIYIEEADDNG